MSYLGQSLPWWCGHWRAGDLANSASSQAQIYSFELAHPNIYSIYNLLESMKGQVLQIQSCRISVTQGIYLKAVPVRLQY